MRKLSSFLIFAAACLASTSPLHAKADEGSVVIVDTSVVPIAQEGVLTGRDVTISDGIVTSIVPTGTVPLPDGARSYDGSGLFLMPGLREAHAHVTAVDSQAQKESEGERIAPSRDRTEHRLRRMLSQGITSVRDLGMPEHLLPLARELRARHDLPHFSFAGPVIDGKRTPWSSNVEINVESPNEGVAAIDRLAASGVDFVKLYQGVDERTYRAMTARARELGLPVAGHVPFAVTTRDTVGEGMLSVQHTYLNLIKDCTDLGNKAPFATLDAWIKQGYEGRWKVSSEIYRGRDADTCRSQYRHLGEAGLFLVATPQMDLPFSAMIGDRELADLSPEARESCEAGIKGQSSADPEIVARWTDDLAEHYRELREAGIRLVAGSDAPTDCMSFGSALVASVQLFEDLGLTRQAALETVTRNAALMMGEETGGIVAEGARADLILLGANPLENLDALDDVRAVMLAGEWVGEAREITAYRGANVWNGTGFVRRDFAVSDGRFVEPGDTLVTRDIDLSGRFVVPGFANAHAHRTTASAGDNRYYLANGVFYVWNPNTVQLGESAETFFARRDTYDVALAMGGITTPGGHPERLYVDLLSKWVYTTRDEDWFRGNAFHYGRSEEEIGQSLDMLAAQGADFVKAYLLVGEQFAGRSGNPDFRGYYGIDPSLAASLVEQAGARGLKTAWHVQSAQDLVTIAKAGAYMAAHLPGYNFAQPRGGLAAARHLLTEAEAQLVADSGMWLVPTYGLLTNGKLSDGEMAEARRVQHLNLERLKAAGARFLLGTDTRGSIGAEVAHLASLEVFTDRELLEIALRTGPTLFPHRQIGCLDAGCEADFVVLGEDPTIEIRAIGKIEAAYKAGLAIDVSDRSPPVN